MAGQSNAQGGVEKNVPAAVDDRVSCIDFFQRDQIDNQSFPFIFSHVSAGASVGPSNAPYLWGILGDSLTKRLNVPILFLGAAQGEVIVLSGMSAQQQHQMCSPISVLVLRYHPILTGWE
ncbi:hypothetical protein GO730_06800 [Spirosoma sp. HMF3257]|uniref:hypothetical protein n=1 Tax=Spirosoma telluris TaxID=2183553 RepID=UPI0011B93D69|nr:hypothetical protein [Spirosoma telluris]